MSDSTDFLFIDSADALSDLCQQLRDDSWLAVDTEFVRDSTYYPEFCLLQIGNQTLSACIDVLAIDDLSPLLELMFNPDCVKVFHAASQDLELFYHLCQRIPSPVFDTQIAAPLLGFAEQVGYATLASQYLGVQLAKGQQRTDWSKRPLSQAQLSYAADDVRYLAQLYPAMQKRLKTQKPLQRTITRGCQLRTALLGHDCVSDEQTKQNSKNGMFHRLTRYVIRA